MKIRFTEEDKAAFARLKVAAKELSDRHQTAIGVVEAALGASALALAVHNGVFGMAVNLVASAISGPHHEQLIGAGVGAGAGASAGAWLGGIGIAFGGTAIGVPAALLIGGGALVLGALGYKVGDLVHEFLHPSYSLGQIVGGATLVVVGLALLVDGLRRVARDPQVRAHAAYVRDDAIHLGNVAVNVVARNTAELRRWARNHDLEDAALYGSAAVAGVAIPALLSSTSAGTSLAVAAPMAMLGVPGFGAGAVTMGVLAAAPVMLPILLCGAAVVGYATWRSASGAR